MKRQLCGIPLLLGLLPAQAIEFTIGSDSGDSQFHQPGATAVGQVFIFPRSGFETSFLIDGITFWGKASPSTVQFKLGYVNGDQFYEGFSSSYTFGAGGGDGEFETIHFDLPNLRFPSGYYVLGYFTGLPDNASFRLNSWSSDAYTSELNYLALYNAGDPTCSIYYQQNGLWAHDPNDLGFLAQLSGTYTGDMSSNKELPTEGFLPGVPLSPGFQINSGGSPQHGVPDGGACGTLLVLSLGLLGLVRHSMRGVPQ
jgi:hypothetical protein